MTPPAPGTTATDDVASTDGETLGAGSAPAGRDRRTSASPPDVDAHVDVGVDVGADVAVGRTRRGARPSAGARVRPESLSPWWIAGGVGAVLLAVIAGVVIGPVRLSPFAVVRELLGLHSGLTSQQSTIVWEFRLPRVVLGLMVGAVLSLAGGAYQATFRNPLADPYLLGVAGGAGFGATLVIVSSAAWATAAMVPVGAFLGGLAAMGLTYLVGAAGDRDRTSISLVLAGVAVSAFFTALQTYLQQRNQDDIRRVYTWILGRLSTSGWHDVLLLLPYAAVCTVVLLACRRRLDVLAVGDAEASALGANPRRLRLVVVLAATLGTAAAVAVSGLIVFVGIIVPHVVRLLAGSSARVVLPLSVLFGAAFLVLTDLAARTVLAPAELPIGVVTAFLGAPFFVLVLRSARPT